MSDLDNFHLDKWQTPPEPDRAHLGWRLGAAAAVLVALLGAAYVLLWRRTPPPAQDVKVHTEQAVPPAAARPAEPGMPVDLPPLEQTDPIVRELVGRLSSHPTVAAWLTTDQLLRNFTVVTLNISNGRSPSGQLTRVRPAGPFQVRQDGTAIYIDPRSYRRYDGYADAVAALDARGVAQLYATLKPRIQDSYRELGHPDGNVDAALEGAIAELLKTPVVEGDIALTSKSVAYEFADPRLQSLSSAQRQFLRMGPRNVRLIQAKLREIASLAGLTPESTP